jgi:hypothetical protein
MEINEIIKRPSISISCGLYKDYSVAVCCWRISSALSSLQVGPEKRRGPVGGLDFRFIGY